MGIVLRGGRKTADFLGDRTSPKPLCGAKNSSIDDPGQAAVT
jgi:hypothetical protein